MTSKLALLEKFKPRPAVAFGLLITVSFLWATSTVISRGVHMEMPPFALSFWRWFVAALIFLPMVWRELGRKRELIAANMKLICLLGVLQVGSAAILVLGLNFTTAINGSLINASQPALTVLPAWFLARDRVTFGQGIGISAAVVGIVVMISRADLGVLTGLGFNVGDLLALTAMLGWAFYATLLHRLPAEIGLTTSLFLILLTGSLALLPFYVVEAIAFRTMALTGTAVGVILFLGIMASAVSILIWNACLRAVGPNRAMIFLNAIPVFAVGLAIVFLGEELFTYHLLGAALVATGVFLVITRARRRWTENPS